MASILVLLLVTAASANLRVGDPPSYMRDASAKDIAEERHKLGIEKGVLLAELYSNCTVKYNDSLHIAELVRVKAGQKIKDSKQQAAAYDKKISSATPADNVKDSVSGESPKMKWMDKRDNEIDEARFYGQIVSNAETVKKDATKGLQDVVLLRGKVNKEFDKVERVRLPVESQVEDAESNHRDAKLLWQQWQGATKDYTCKPTPVTNHALSQCKDGNTKFGIKCLITCIPGYDCPKDSKNRLRCRKEGKFGKQLYGEWKGLATCIGRMCGKPAQIPKSKTVIQELRFPHAAIYNCYQGYSQDGDAKGPKSFSVPCDKTGHFAQNSSHACKLIKCGPAPPVKNSVPIPGTFYYSDRLTIQCKHGHTLDSTPGGQTKHSTSCQATGRFTQTQQCKRVRCGPPLVFPNSVIKSGKDDQQFFNDEVTYKCKNGHSTDQANTGPKAFTLRCSADAKFFVKGGKGHTPIPRCRPVSAGLPPLVPNGSNNRREMFFGETVVVTADIGYSTTGKPTEGLAFTLSATANGTFAGLKKFIRIVCGPPKSVKNAVSSFANKEAVYADVLKYDCKDGYSTDTTAAKSAKSFAIQCEADADLSKVPALGYCANIDDCRGHTCGPFGSCVDHLNNYTCNCQSGYAQVWDNKSHELLCGNVDDCGPQACGVGECKDLVNDYKCICPVGYKEGLDAEEKTCKAKVCGTPPQVAHSATSPVEAADEKASYKNKVTYQCDSGFTLDGTATGKNHFTIECKADKQFTATKSCKPIKCGKGPQVKHATMKPATATFNESIKYNCKDGYTIDGTAKGDGEFDITCLVTGEYSEQSECNPVNCGEPEEVPSASRPAGSLVYKQSATYKCFVGFTLDSTPKGPTEFKTACHVDGSLDELKDCLPKVCGEAPKLIKALHATVPDEGLVAFPRTTEVTCRNGYTVGGSAGGNTSFLVKCLSSGQFSKYDKAGCAPVRCAAPPAMANASLDHVYSPHRPEKKLDNTVLNFDEKAFYKCKPGFSTGGEPDAPKIFKVECLPSGEFSAPPPDMQCRNINDCERHTCGPKGLCIDQVGPSPAYTCKCDFGFEIQTQKNGEKSCGNTDDCKDQDCGTGTCKDLVGDYTCICPIGHYIGKINGKKTCIPVRCAERPPTLAHGKRLSSHNGGAIDFPTTLRYKCDKGWSIDGSVAASKRKFIAHCKPDGQLSGIMRCQKITCGTPRVLPFTHLVSPSSPRKSIDYEETVKYKCFDGYNIGGRSQGAREFSVSCPDSGDLTDPKVCDPVKCGPAPRVPKAHGSIAGDVFFGSHLEYKCALGYTLDGAPNTKNDFKRECKKDGTFSALTAAQPCKAVFAGKAPALPNAFIWQYGSNRYPNGIASVDMHYPNSIEYKCKPGFSENGAPSGATKFASRVTTSGRLFPALPAKCSPIQFTIRGLVKNARNGRALSGVSIRLAGTNNVVRTSFGFFVLHGVSPGSVSLVYERGGYIKNTKVLVVNGNVNTGGVADVSMSQTMRSDEWRAVIKWDRRPSDLDTYAKWGSTQTCWWNTRARSMGLTGVLEKDDTNGYGPETLFLKGVGNCRLGSYYCDIRYIINDYTESGRMKDISKAQVTLYTGTSVAGTWKIETCRNSVSGDGNWWHVFTLDGKTNKLKWSCEQGGAGTHMLQTEKTEKSHAPTDYNSYVGPFPGRFFRHSQRRASGNSTPPAVLMIGNSTSQKAQAGKTSKFVAKYVAHRIRR